MLSHAVASSSSSALSSKFGGKTRDQLIMLLKVRGRGVAAVAGCAAVVRHFAIRGWRFNCIAVTL